ncbi:MAG: Lrp/AsnC family transcriptional regulator [Candidatus Diapherotrites archaeon]
MEKMTKRELQTLLEILKEGRVSDQEIARRLKTSRPSIAIIRKKLEEKGIILGYYPIIDFKKIG